MSEFLAFVKNIGNTLDGQNIYEFMFTTVPDVVWGDNFNIIPAGIIPNLTPEPNCLSRKGRVITDIDFHLACKSTCFSMMDLSPTAIINLLAVLSRIFRPSFPHFEYASGIFFAMQKYAHLFNFLLTFLKILISLYIKQ